MTVTTAAQDATLPVIRSLLGRASREGKHRSGVLGIRARPEWPGQREFTMFGLAVTVCPCSSALAVREALRQRQDGTWLVVLTDRDESDLGLTLTSQFVGSTLRNPDPWDAVRDQFGATRLDRRLVAHPHARALAAGTLAVRGETPWPPARGGFLTLAHVCAVVANRRLAFPLADDSVATEDVLRWATTTTSRPLLEELRTLAGDALSDAVTTWLAEQCGNADPIVRWLLRQGRVDDVVPLGLAARAVLACPAGSEPWVLLRVQQLDLPEVTPGQLTALVAASEQVTRGMVESTSAAQQQQANRILARADALVRELRALAGADTSELLPVSLTFRLSALGESLRRATERSATIALAGGPEVPLVDADGLAATEQALQQVQAHVLAEHRQELRVPRALAGVRLARWLAGRVEPEAGFVEVMRAYRDVDSWVDRAYADAWRGVDDEQLAQGLRGVLAAARLRRKSHDRAFGTDLAAATARDERRLAADVLPIEDLLRTVVLPIAADAPVLLVVADGMSSAVGAEIVDDLGGRYDSWLECLPEGQSRRTVAVSGLPSLTTVSRCSLLTGTRSVGGQEAERSGFEALLRAQHLTGRLFHKMSLESSGAGAVLSAEVASAVDDIGHLAVVACVLNTIDDALDRSDPGIDWTTDTVAHLAPLLERARRAGRTVVLTSDHGHVIERREGHLVPVPGSSSNRSRPAANGPAPTDGEVRVSGPRVQYDGDAVLAVDEELRYGPLKAGYHGGGSPAEVVVPVHVLTAGTAPRGWTLAAPQAPLWWYGPIAVSIHPESAPPRQPRKTSTQPALFEDDAPVAAPVPDLASAVLTSTVYEEQRRRAQRVPIPDNRIEALLRGLINAPSNRLNRSSAAVALGVPVVRLDGALPLAQRLLNVEQYPVVTRDSDGTTILLDIKLLVDQFGVRA